MQLRENLGLTLQKWMVNSTICGHQKVSFWYKPTNICFRSPAPGDFLIDKLKLEIKYPKLARFIKLKQTLNKGHILLTIFYS